MGMLDSYNHFTELHYWWIIWWIAHVDNRPCYRYVDTPDVCMGGVVLFCSCQFLFSCTLS